ncbi:hypothetical protein EJB05_41161, partial [Eragrostis curvula]
MGISMSTARYKICRFNEKPNGGMFALLGLQVLLEYGRTGAARPPVTAALLAANSLVYLRLGPLDDILPMNCDVSFNPYRIIEGGQWSRLLSSPFVHAHEPHIFFNMTNLLWLGSELEPAMGSARFAAMVATLLGLSQGITLLLCKGLYFLGDGTEYFVHHAVGFSGVLFAMKVVWTAWCPKDTMSLVLVMPAKYTTWAELLLTKTMVPQSSFIGHLGGILAGYVYLRLNRLFGGPEPPTRRFAPRAMGARHASARKTPPPGLWRCSSCACDNLLSSNICGTCSTAREDLAFMRRRLQPPSSRDAP